MEKEPNEMTVDGALAELAVVESSLHTTGAVDVETSALAQIRHDLLNGQLNPEEAIAKARAMIEARSDYH